MTGCTCTGPGFCERHGIVKNENWYQLCKTKVKYFRAWEAGAGPGQHPKQMKKVRTRVSSNIGNILARRFEAIGLKPVPGCPCKDLQGRLNDMSPEAVMSDLAGLAVRLRQSAKKWKELKGGLWNIIPTPPLWICKRVLEDAVKEAKGQIAAEQLTDLTEPGK